MKIVETTPHDRSWQLLSQTLSDASLDLTRHLLGAVINPPMSPDADAVCAAEYSVVLSGRFSKTDIGVGYGHDGVRGQRDQPSPAINGFLDVGLLSKWRCPEDVIWRGRVSQEQTESVTT